MKILALNGSPRARGSNTQRMIEPFFEGARDAGAETETVFVKDLDIGFCLGCFKCWHETPGKCVQRDDMDWLLDKMLASDVIIWGTPLYHFGMTAMLKAVLERTIPLVDPHVMKFENSYGHPMRDERVDKKMMLIANCGFPERHHFDSLLELFHCMGRSGDGLDLEVILRPEGELMKVEELAPHIVWYFEALKQAGREYVGDGRISDKTHEILSRDLLPVESFVSLVNEYWDNSLTLKQDKDDEK